MNLEGDIREIDVVGRLVELGREQFTGAIRFENDGIIKIIYFKGGDILSASTNDRADSIDELLLRAGKVTREHVKQALAKRKETETLGDALLNLGFITRKELTWARRVQVIGVIRSIDAWPGGSYTIVADYLPKREEGTLFPLGQLITELIVTDHDRSKFDRALDGGTAVFEHGADFDTQYRKLGLNQDADAIVAQIDGSRTAAEVASLSGKDAFNVYKLLHALATLGLLTRRQVPPAASFDDHLGMAPGAVADAADMWDVPSLAEPPVVEDRPPATIEIPTESLLDAAPELDLNPGPMAAMPAWDVATTPAPVPTPAPPPIPMPVETKWGFDDAQIETARRAHEEEPPPPMKKQVEKASRPNRWIGLLIASVLIIIFGVGGYAGVIWWNGRQATPTAQLVVRKPKPHLGAPAAPPAPVPAPTTDTTASNTQPVAPAPTPAPQPATPLPVVTRKTPSPAPTPTQPAAATGSNYDAMARDFLANAGSGYTVQIELVCEPASITKALKLGGKNIWFVPITYRGRSCYRVFWGRFDNRAAAAAAMGQIPAGLRESGAAVISVPKP